MCKKAWILPGQNDENLKVIQEQIKCLKGKIELSTAPDGRMLFSEDELPFIWTDEGDRFFGLSGLSDFILSFCPEKEDIVATA